MSDKLCLICSRELTSTQKDCCSVKCKNLHKTNAANQRWVNQKARKTPRCITHANFNVYHHDNRKKEETYKSVDI
jgi:hypothetical protein